MSESLPGKLELGFHLGAGVRLSNRDKINIMSTYTLLLFISLLEHDVILAKTALPVLLVQIYSE
jgi:hypothetical protein